MNDRIARMPPYIRRSIYLLSVNDPHLAEKAFESWADAIVLTIPEANSTTALQTLGSRLPSLIEAARRGGAEVFVRIAFSQAQRGLDVVLHPGLTGIVLAGARCAGDVQQVSRQLKAFESARALTDGDLEIDLEFSTAEGIWNSLELARACERVGTFTIDEEALYANLGIPFTTELAIEPLEFIKGQLITVATSVQRQAQGMSYPLCVTGKASNPVVLKAAIRRARDTGFKGALCPDPSWIRHCNEGFRPSVDEISYYKEVRAVFAEGLKRGLASVPLSGKMIDVPVDLRAEVYLDWAARAQHRDQEKALAHQC